LAKTPAIIDFLYEIMLELHEKHDFTLTCILFFIGKNSHIFSRPLPFYYAFYDVLLLYSHFLPYFQNCIE